MFLGDFRQSTSDYLYVKIIHIFLLMFDILGLHYKIYIERYTLLQPKYLGKNKYCMSLSIKYSILVHQSFHHMNGAPVLHL